MYGNDILYPIDKLIILIKHNLYHSGFMAKGKVCNVLFTVLNENLKYKYVVINQRV